MTDLAKLKERASEAFAKAKFAKAAELYEAYCKGSPKDLQSHLRMGDAFARSGNKPKAIGAYQFAAEGFAKDGFLPRAIAASKLILELDPSHRGVQQMLADLYARRGINEGRPPPRKEPARNAGPAHRADAIELPPDPSDPLAMHDARAEEAAEKPKVIELPPMSPGEPVLAAADVQELPPELAPDLQPIVLDTPKKAPAARVFEIDAEPTEKSDPSIVIDLELEPAAEAPPSRPSATEIELEPDPFPAASSPPAPAAQGIARGRGAPAASKGRSGTGEATIELELDAPIDAAARNGAGAAAIELEVELAPAAATPTGPGSAAGSARASGVEVELEVAPSASPSSSGGTVYEIDSGGIALEVEVPAGAAAVAASPAAVSPAEIELSPADAVPGDDAMIERDRGNARPSPPPAMPSRAAPGASPTPPGLKRRSGPPAPAPNAPGGLPAGWSGNGSELQASLAAFSKFDELDLGDSPLPLTTETAPVLPAAPEPAAARLPNSPAPRPAPPQAPVAAAEASTRPAPVAKPKPRPAISFTELELSGDSLLHAVELAAQAAHPEEEPPEPAPEEPSDSEQQLPQIPLFSDLPPEAFIALFERCPLRRLREKERVIAQGSVGDAFYVICEGKVRVVREEAGLERELAVLEHGACFGEMALLSGAPRTASVESAAEDTQLLEISAPVLAELSQEHPQVAQALKKFCRQRMLSNVMDTAPLFRLFNKKDRRALVQRFRAREVKVEERVIEAGQRSDGLYVVLSGEMSVEIGGRQVAKLKEGDLFGEMSLLQKSPATASVVATKRSSLLRLPREDFDELILSHPQILVLISELTDDRKKKNQALLSAPPAAAESRVVMV